MMFGVLMLAIAYVFLRAISIGRYVDWYKHRDWEYYAAYNYVSQNSLPLDLAYVLLAAAVWIVPAQLLSAAEADVFKAFQVGATILIWIGSNLTYQALIDHIRKPPPAQS